jgi:hypothetical protein
MTLKQCEEGTEIIKAKLVKAGYELKKTEEGTVVINWRDKEASCNKYNYIHPEHGTRILVQYCKETSGSSKYEFITMAYFKNTDTKVGLRIREEDLESSFKRGINRYISKCKEIAEAKQYTSE